MRYPDWREPKRHLRQLLGPPSDEQLALAAYLGMRLGKRTPYVIAGALLGDAAAGLVARPRREPSYFQLLELVELAEWARHGDLVEPATADLADAMIRLRAARRAIVGLDRLRPCAGDIVYFGRPDGSEAGDIEPDFLMLVDSVDEGGRVHAAAVGGESFGHDAHGLQPLFRASNMSPDAGTARRKAEESAHQSRDRAEARPSHAKLRPLIPWHLPRRGVRQGDRDEFRSVLQTAADERPIQDLLERRPQLLGSLVRAHPGAWVIPLVRLGDRYVADFFIAGEDSRGLSWILVELESPRARLFTQTGEWRKEARHAQHQIRQWRHYIRENLDAARKPRSDEGLGLVGIEPTVPGLILIGRRSFVSEEPGWMRRDLEASENIAMHTYDWLLERVERSASDRH
jgi:hypothetical protein